MENLNIFKIEYDWHEGDHGEILLGKRINRESFENDFIKAKEFAESLVGKKIEDENYIGKGYHIECLPAYYEQIVWFLINKLGYIECNYNDETTYHVEDTYDREILINKSKKKVETIELKGESNG